MQIRPLDLDNADEVHDFYQALRSSDLLENPDRPTWSEAELVGHLREPVGEDVVADAAFDDESSALAGGTVVFYPVLDNLTMAYVELFVAPDQRTRGVGGALVEHVVEQVKTVGRTTILANVWMPFEKRDAHPNRRFAEKHGFTLASTEVARRLDLPIPDGQIQAWIDEAAPHHADYRIESFSNGDIPAELLPSFCHATNQLAVEAPTGEIDFEPEGMTPELWLQRRARDRKQGMDRYDTVAVDGSGTVVALTTMGVPAGDPLKVHQWATIVLPEHRGHRLGLAVKALNLRAVQREHPERTSVHTCNSEVNGPMIDINERVGFKPVELLADFQRKLDS